MNKNRKTIIYAAVVLGLLFLFWNPFTRQAVLWILPLGSGIDDLIFVLLAVVGFTIVTVRVVRFHGEVIKEQIKRNWKWFVVGVVAFIVIAFIFLQIYPIY